MVKKNCFAFNGVDCNALKELYCKNETCKFCKTEKEYREGLKKYPPLKTKGLKL